MTVTQENCYRIYQNKLGFRQVWDSISELMIKKSVIWEKILHNLSLVGLLAYYFFIFWS